MSALRPSGPSALTVDDGSSATCGVRLDTEPNATVTVTWAARAAA